MVAQMGQRAWPGEEVCTVYSANVWVALPTRALHIHACVPSASHFCLSVSLSVHTFCTSSHVISDAGMCQKINGGNDLEELYAI